MKDPAFRILILPAVASIAFSEEWDVSVMVSTPRGQALSVDRYNIIIAIFNQARWFHSKK